MRALFGFVLLASFTACSTDGRRDWPRITRDLSQKLQKYDTSYKITQEELVYDPPSSLVQPLIESYRNDLEALNAFFDSKDPMARRFAIQALSRSRQVTRHVLFSRWIGRLLDEKSHDDLVVALWYAPSLVWHVELSLAQVRDMMTLHGRPVSRLTSLSLRNLVLVPMLDQAESAPLEYFELVLERMALLLSGSHSPEDLDVTNEILESLTTRRYRRGSRTIAAIPLPESGPLHFPASKDGRARLQHWQSWYGKYRQYLVWVPWRWSDLPGLLVNLPDESFYQYVGGGFFILDEEALADRRPTREYRKEKPWGKDEGPLSADWFP